MSFKFFFFWSILEYIVPYMFFDIVMDPQLQPEGSYKFILVRPCVRASVHPAKTSVAGNPVLRFFLKFSTMILSQNFKKGKKFSPTMMKLCPMFLPRMGKLCPNISRQKGGMNLIFLRANKHKIFLEVDSINFGGQGQSCSKYPK